MVSMRVWPLSALTLTLRTGRPTTHSEPIEPAAPFQGYVPSAMDSALCAKPADQTADHQVDGQPSFLDEDLRKGSPQDDRKSMSSSPRASGRAARWREMANARAKVPRRTRANHGSVEGNRLTSSRKRNVITSDPNGCATDASPQSSSRSRLM